MIEKLKKTEWFLGLHAFDPSPPSPDEFRAFFEVARELLVSIGAAPTYVAASGKGYSGKSAPIDGPVQKKLVQTGFTSINFLDLTANPEGSDAPAFDRFATVGLSFTRPNEISVYFGVNEAFVSFGSVEFYRILETLASFRDWSFGFAILDDIERDPELHIIGADNGKLSPEEYEALCAWYDATSEERELKLRDLYPVMLLNREQADQRLADGRNVEQYLKDHADVRALESSNLLLCTIDPAKIQSMRAELAESSVFIQ